MSFAKLDAHCRALGALDHALAILGTDEATHMAPGGGESRAEAMASLSGMYHRQATDKNVADWIAAAKAETLSSEQQIAVGEFERSYINMTCLPTDFIERKMRTSMRSEQLWRKARPKGDWAAFQPALEAVVAMMREEAAMRAEVLELAPYDALMEQFDPGNRTAAIDPVFAELKAFLVEFVPEALAVQQERLQTRPLKPLSGDYPVERQKALGLAMMQAIGFDMNHGSLSVSDHPFCGGVPSDVRMTTRYRTDEFLPALMGILHETGHGLYEQNLPKDWTHWPSGKARGMSIHESQSLFVEKQIGRNPAFWHFALPQVDAHLKESWTIEDLLPHVHQVRRGKIRVDADEVTYPLHVILRYELEQDLLSGRVEVKDVPDAWDAKMQESLGISTIDDPQNGPMQDVHWPSGSFGYFPSYTLGALMAAQQWAAIQKTNPDVDAQIAAGDFELLNAWRRDNIWAKASTASTPEILKQATGEELNPAYFIAHLRARYGKQ
ncbi:carboxypeptidase M32 [Hoeflea sp. YIM 152468]|uniref:carboxypeptidase M32 n=1 Tax=Hoeflea sp. YIM 152468 TaxID=3031759 RepID=UPI0023DA23D4|nr:carboxypeptidase M32 [Hoeflea sp. YIM 152468]MDF1609004.1 carboxypeptidase M32 [Hoeflea sp. YIM 152468]